MTPDMRVILPELRQIGFEVWDPLGLRETFAEGAPIADEYDGYLLPAFSVAYKNGSLADINNILCQAETGMGLSDNDARTGKRNETVQRLFTLAMKLPKPLA